MFNDLKNFFIGPPLPTQALSGTRLNKIRALAAFSPDALSSIAYANQEIYLGLVIAGYAGLSLSIPIGLAIAALLVIVAISYYQTIQGYPNGGGSFIVAGENLGTLPGLVAASALLIDYLLNAAVSLTAGVAAIASAFPVLWNFRVELALFLLVIITMINLRGMQETGTLMAIPVYLFLFSYLLMLAYGIFQAIVNGPGDLAAVAPPPQEPLTLVLILHAFSAGCTALTGIEAISNGVPAFQPPQAKNAGRTLIIMALLMGLLFTGSIGLTQYLGVIAGAEETILSALARRLLGSSFPYMLIQISTLLILTVAANTSFAGFPRVVAILADQGFMPRQLTILGDRLVYTNGITLLSVTAGLLILLFRGDTHQLIPLFAVGAFLAFTLSQTGMVMHWWRKRGRGWRAKMAANFAGAMATGITLLIIAINKFLAGAWITVLLIPLLVYIFYRIRAHYRQVLAEISLKGLPPSLKPKPPARMVIPISGIHRGVVEAVNFARSISANVTGVYVELEPGASEAVKKEWENWFPDIPLAVVQSPYRSIVGPILDYLDRVDQEYHDGQLTTVILPELVPARWWQGLLHNQTALMLKTAVLYRRRKPGFQRVIINVPFHIHK